MEMNLSIEKMELINPTKRERYKYVLVITKGIGIREQLILQGGKSAALRLIEFGVKKDF